MVLAVGDNGSEASTLPSTALCSALLQQRAAEPGIGQSGFNLDHGCAELLIGQPSFRAARANPRFFSTLKAIYITQLYTFQGE